MDRSSQLNLQAMKGEGGSNHDWANFFSPASSLSAFAAPFNVNSYASSDVASQFTNSYVSSNMSSQFLDSATHIVDSTESAADTAPPIHYQTFGFDFSNPVRPLDSTPLGTFPSYTARTSFVEPQSYPMSSAIHDHHASSVPPYRWSPVTSSSAWAPLKEADNLAELGFSGQKGVSWERFPEFNGSGKGKQVAVGGSSLSPKETAVSAVVEGIVKQAQADKKMKDSVNGEVSHIIDRENYNVPAIPNPSLDTSRGTIKSMSGEFLGASVVQYPSMSVESRHEDPLKVVADSGNNYLSNIGSYDNHPIHVDKSSRVDTVSSMPRTGLTTDMNIDDIISDQHVVHKNFFLTKEGVRPCPGISGCFDPYRIHEHLGRSEPSTSNKAMVSDKTVSRDDVDYIFKGRTEYQTPHANMDTLSLRHGAIEDVNIVEKSFEGGDRCNPAEDSPCWKGASAARFSYFKPSAVLPQDYVHKRESSYVPVIQESQNYLLNTEKNTKNSAENSNGYQMQTDFVYQGTGSAGSSRKFSSTNFAYEDYKLGSAVNGEPFPFKPNYDFGLQFMDITKMKGNSVPPAKATNFESGSSHMEHQVAEKNKLISQKQHTSCIGDAKAGCNVNKFLEHGSSYKAEHVPLPLVVNTTTTPSSVVGTTTTPSSAVDTTTTPSVVETTTTPSVVDTTTTPSVVDTTTTPSVVETTTTPSVVETTTTPVNTAGGVATEKLNVQILVNTMQNLSELLLYHCENGVCELKERDCNVLKDVISNLNTCALKSAEQIAPAQECLISQPETFNCARELHELHQNVSLKRLPSTKIGPEISKVENPLAAEANLHFRSPKPLSKLSVSISSRREATEMTMTGDMTKDLKRTLNENFHEDEGADPQTALYKNLWLEAEAELCSVYYKARYNQIKIEMDNHSYKEREMENQSKSEVVPTLSQSQSSETKGHGYPNRGSSCLNSFTDVNKPSNAMTPGGRGGQNLDKAIDSNIVSSLDSEAERNDESSVMARYQVLIDRVDQFCIDTTNPEEPLDMADKSSPRGSDNQNAVNFCQDSPIPEKNSTDYEASVVARFHILKSRLEGSSSISLEGKQLDGVGSPDKDMDDEPIIKTFEGKGLDVHENPAMVYLDSYFAMDKSIPEGFHQHLEHSQESQPCRTIEFQLSNYHSDGFSSDWEQVEKSL